MSSNTQLYLTIEIGPGAEAALAVALGVTTISSVLIRAAPGQTIDAPTAKSLISIIQKCGSAALIADDANLARMLKADGVHLTWNKDQEARFGAARDILGPRFIIGADAGRSRHDAMTLGEAGADYIAFGIPPHVSDRAAAIERRRELINWWSEIFEVPCVAFDTETTEEAQTLAQANADFVGLNMPVGLTPQAAKSWIAGYTLLFAPKTVAV